MATPRAHLDQVQYAALREHLLKHKSYPYSYGVVKNIDNTDFDTAYAAAGVRYFTYEFTPTVDTGIVSLATNLIVTPETSFGFLGIQMSYRPTLDLADNPTKTAPKNEGSTAYNVFTNGGAINDFQVFFPLNYFVRSRETLYIHVFADTTLCTAGTSDLRGQLVLGTFPLT